jgi:hypothetical protein
LASTQIASCRLTGPIPVHLHQVLRSIDKPVERWHGGHRDTGINAGQEASFGLVQVADSGQVALVEQACANRSIRFAHQTPNSLGEIPIGSEQVWTQVPHRGLLRRCPKHLDNAQAEANAYPFARRQDEADLKTRAPPRPARAIDVPRTVHLEMSVHGDALLGADQQVLASGHHLQDHAAGEIDRGIRGYSEIAGHQDLVGQDFVQPVGCAPDGVALGHVSQSAGVG